MSHLYTPPLNLRGNKTLTTTVAVILSDALCHVVEWCKPGRMCVTRVQIRTCRYMHRSANMPGLWCRCTSPYTCCPSCYMSCIRHTASATCKKTWSGATGMLTWQNTSRWTLGAELKSYLAVSLCNIRECHAT